MSRRTRRQFVRDSAALATGLAVAANRSAFAAEPAGTFGSAWHRTPDRVWIGPEYWANPLQDWRIAAGRVECTKAAPDRHVHLLTYALSTEAGVFTTSVRVGRFSGDLGGGPGSVGFRIGITGELEDYRNALLFGRGLDAGLTGSGVLFLGEPTADDAIAVALALPAVELRFTAEPQGKAYLASLEALDPTSGKSLGKVQRTLAAEQLVGQLALVANCSTRQPGRRQQTQATKSGNGAFWFSDWKASGSKLAALPQRAFGPILFCQYTLSRGEIGRAHV